MHSLPRPAAELKRPALVLNLHFGASGNGVQVLQEGWSTPEADFTWTLGPSSDLLIQLPKPITSDLHLEIRLSPFVAPPRLRSQRLTVRVNNKIVGSLRLSHDAVIGLPIAAKRFRGCSQLHVHLTHPQCGSPCKFGTSSDTRQLGFALAGLKIIQSPCFDVSSLAEAPPLGIPIEASLAQLDSAVKPACGLSLDELVRSFEGLGHNCEFGLVQRRCGAEPLGLLRFIGIKPADLLRGLETGFAGIGSPQNIEPILTGRDQRLEWVIREHLYGLTYHTFLFNNEDDNDRDTVLRKQIQKLHFEQRKLHEDFLDPQKIFVFQSGSLMSPYEALPVLTRLRVFGPAKLLFITSDAASKSGGVVEICEGLYQGHIDRLAPWDDAGNLSLQAWVSILANTWRIHTQRQNTPNDP